MKLLNKDGHEVSKIDFGIVEVGKTKTVEYQFHNDDGTYVDLIDITLEDIPEAQEVIVGQHRTELSADSQTAFSLTWTPTLKVKKGLQLKVEVSYRTLWR